jgi:phage major head subunit gpT-like protein
MLIRQQFPDLFLTTMLPALDEIIFNRFKQLPPCYSKVFRMMTSVKSIEQSSEIVGLSTFAQVAEGANVRYDEAMPGFSKTYTHVQFGLGFRISRIMVDDDKFGIINKLASDLGRSARETKELEAVTDFNNGFSGSFLGPDGKALFATDHPLVKSGGVQTNKAAVAADLSISALELALTDFRLMKDPTGKRIRVKPQKLLIPAELEFVASEMLYSPMRSDTANNAINAFKHRIGVGAFDEVMIWEYLSDPDSWFISASKEDIELRWYDREAFNTIHDVDFDSRSIKTAGWMRFSHGWSSPFGLYGVEGA